MSDHQLENTPYIDNFPKDDHLWRVDWFGPVSQSPKKEKEHDVFVQLSPFVGSPKEPAATKAVDSNQHVIRYIGVGLLPYVHIGSIWRNGNRESLKDFKYSSMKLPVEISKQSMDIKKPIDIIEHGQRLIPGDWHSISTLGKRSRCLTINYKRVQHKIIIPQTELIRFDYVESMELAVDIFSGLLRSMV